MHTIKVYYIYVFVLIGIAVSSGLAGYLFWPREDKKPSK